MENKYQRTLSYALLIYISVIVVLITLIPFDFRLPREFKITWSINFDDVITNIFLFIPVGFLFKLGCRKSKDPYCLMALAFGALLSLAVETVQLFVPGRYPQVSDIITNGLGAWLGAMIFHALKIKLKEKKSFKLFALELPLMNLVYLLIPLMWLNALATGAESSRLWLMLLLGLLGGGVLSSIYRSRFKNTEGLSPNKLSLFAMSWFFMATIPAMLNFPKKILIFGILVGIFEQILSRIPQSTKNREQRFELPTLKKLLPAYAVYLFLLAAWPTTLPIGEWQFNINFEELTFNERIIFIFRFIESIAAFTLLGYIIAEMRGRKNESVEKTLGWAFIIAVGSAIFIEMVKSYPTLASMNMLSIIIIISANIYGVVLYRLQLSAIERLNF